MTFTAGDNVTLTADKKTITIAAKDTWTAWKGATASANGTAGYMPAPVIANREKYLRGDGTWQTLNNYSHPETAGNKHVPSGGTADQTLIGTGTSGEAAWVNKLKVTVSSKITATLAADKKTYTYSDTTNATSTTYTSAGSNYEVIFEALSQADINELWNKVFV